MARQIAACQAHLELTSWRFESGKKHGVTQREISTDIAMLKVNCTLLMETCAREAVQIFGGRGTLIGKSHKDMVT
eukprot:gene17683-5548_t